MTWEEDVLASALALSHAALGAGLLLTLLRLLRGPTLPDRVVALDLGAVLAAALAAVHAVETESPVFLSAAIVVALLSFLGTVAFAGFLQKRKQR